MTLRLIPATPRDFDTPSPALARGIAAGFAPGATSDLVDALSALERQRPTPPWSSYWGLCEADRTIHGLCGFKAPPDRLGQVEIAYFTFPRLEGRGVAGGMAAALVEIAAGRGLPAVLAHTLPERNASGSVLTRLGFDFAGTVEDPEDGEVWRWILKLR